MKEISAKQLSRNASALLDIAQAERVIVTRKGKPSAILLGIEYKDEEDYALEHDAEFWRMIRERRKEKTIPHAEIKKILGISGKASRVKKSKVGK